LRAREHKIKGVINVSETFSDVIKLYTAHCWLFYIDVPTNVYGEHLRQQVENRLKFYETGETPAKNADVMKQAEAEVCLNCTFISVLLCLQSFDSVGWVSGRAYGVQKNWLMRSWHGYWCRVNYKRIVCISADAAVTPLSLCLIKIQICSGAGLPTMYWKRGH